MMSILVASQQVPLLSDIASCNVSMVTGQVLPKYQLSKWNSETSSRNGLKMGIEQV